MKSKPRKAGPQKEPSALPAFKRAAKKAVELARRTNTAAYVLENSKLVDIANRRMRKQS